MRIILTFTFLLLAYFLSAQNDSTSTKGEIVSGEVIIEKDKKITLPKADKIYIRSNSRSFDNDPIDIQFQVKEPSLEWPDYKSDVPFQTIQEVYPTEKYQNYVKFGFGNFSSPIFEAGLFKKTGKFDNQAKIFYESFKSGPINDENSGNSIGSIELSSTYRKNSFTITPGLSYQNNQYSFYGNSDRVNSGFDLNDSTEVSLNFIQFDVEFSEKKEEFSYTIRPIIAHTNQNVKDEVSQNKETNIGISGTLDYKIDQKFTTGFDLDLQRASYDGGIALDRSLVNVNPWIKHNKDNLLIRAGFMLSSGKVGDATKTGFYPRLRADYSLSKTWSVYGFFSGGQQWNGLNSLLNENQFLDDSLNIVQSEITSQFGGGIKGSPVKNVLLEAGLSYSSIEGFPFYVPSNSDSSRFTIAYDSESVGLISLKSKLSFMPTATNTYGIEVEINGYSVESLDRPWHKPSYILKAFTSHNIQEKLIVSAYLTSMGGIRGPANVDFGYVKLDAFTDLGLSAKYLFTQRASAFITVNNLLNSEYERYLGYPTRGLTFKIGGQYRF